MQAIIDNPMLCSSNRQKSAASLGRIIVKNAWIVLLAFTLILSACGGSSSGGSHQIPILLSGNWQFSMSSTPDLTPQSGFLGGFLVEKNGAVTGTANYSFTLLGDTVPCSSGTATITGTLSSNTVTLQAVAGTLSFDFNGTAASDGVLSKIAGSFTSTSTAGSQGEVPCGSATTSPRGWTAASLPPLQGFIAGSFHSTGGVSGLDHREFPVTGSISQGSNAGASSATLTGTINFVDPISNKPDYPCAASATIQGQISGNTVVLQLLEGDGSVIGQIGAPDESGQIKPVTLDSSTKGYVLHSLLGTAYSATTTPCPGDSESSTPGDLGSICIALGSTNACQQPVSIFPSALTFAAQAVGSNSAAQKITLQNNQASLLDGLSMTLANACPPGTPGTAGCNFAVTMDSCDIAGNPLGSAFSLLPAQTCTIEITFTPQQADAFTATLTVNTPASADNDTAFAVPITGRGVDAFTRRLPAPIVPRERSSGVSLPELLSFSTQSWRLVQTLHSSSTRSFQDEEHHAQID